MLLPLFQVNFKSGNHNRKLLLMISVILMHKNTLYACITTFTDDNRSLSSTTQLLLALFPSPIACCIL